MKYAFGVTSFATALLVGCSAMGPFTNTGSGPAALGFSGSDYRETMISSLGGAEESYAIVQPPKQCFTPDTTTGKPVSFHRESIIDQPVLLNRQSVRVPSQPVANRNFFCAAFYYSVDQNGRVADVQTLYNSHPGLGGVNFAKDAKRALKDWRYQPGMVDKGRARFTGYTTVFYYGFEG